MSDVTANFATDTQTYRDKDGTEVTYYIRVNFDQIVDALGHRARKSKRHYATALGGAVKITAAERAEAK